MSSVPWVKFIKAKVIFRYHTKGVSKSSFIKFVSQNQKLFIFKFQYESGKKRKRWKKFFELKSGAIRVLQIGAGFSDYKSAQTGFKIGAVVSNGSKENSNWDRDYKLG